MDSSLNELYQEIILEHNRAPRNKCKLHTPTASAQGHNPSCGDDITVFIAVNGDAIEKITFDGEGCAISQASASLMTELLVGKRKKDAAKIISDVCSLLVDVRPETPSDGNNPLEIYGEVAALLGVKKFPMRVKCATLAWHAAAAAISQC
ncbi:MAG: SUF system NifU family Fe-S cluster assembly protein [Puniceicoccales bacterium]|jgi:nitrogen fixation NifU-like protein|nr:SUF system NifU family Fe-S cluster assembly protein [Puniceicoccales bacterium]